MDKSRLDLYRYGQKPKVQVKPLQSINVNLNRRPPMHQKSEQNYQQGISEDHKRLHRIQSVQEHQEQESILRRNINCSLSPVQSNFKAKLREMRRRPSSQYMQLESMQLIEQINQIKEKVEELSRNPKSDLQEELQRGFIPPLQKQYSEQTPMKNQSPNKHSQLNNLPYLQERDSVRPKKNSPYPRAKVVVPSQTIFQLARRQNRINQNISIL